MICMECYKSRGEAATVGEGDWGFEEELRLKVGFDKNVDREVCILFIRRLLAKVRQEAWEAGKEIGEADQTFGFREGRIFGVEAERERLMKVAQEYKAKGFELETFIYSEFFEPLTDQKEK